jgi:hypothetical protein
MSVPAYISPALLTDDQKGQANRSSSKWIFGTVRELSVPFIDFFLAGIS